MTAIDGFILDDNVEFSELIAEFLLLDGLQALQAATLAEGQRLLMELTRLRFAVCDLRLPDGSAVEFVCKVCEKFPTARVVAISGYCEQADEERLRQRGAIFMKKPLDFDALKETLTGS